MAGYGGGHKEECKACGAPPWESCYKLGPDRMCERPTTSINEVKNTTFSEIMEALNEVKEMLNSERKK